MISFFVSGTPRPKGSKHAFLHPNTKRIVMIESAAKDLKPWMSDIRYHAEQHKPNGEVYDGPVYIRMTFGMPRPKSLPKKILEPLKRPDLDKLVRAVLDALKGVLYRDDSQVVELQT